MRRPRRGQAIPGRARWRCAALPCHGLQNRLNLVVIDLRDDRHHQDPHRHPGGGQSPHRCHAPSRRRRRPGLHHPGKVSVQGGDAHGHRTQIALGHRRENIPIAQHQGRFRNNGKRVIDAVQHLDQATGNQPLPFNRLMGIGVGAKGNRRNLISGLALFFFEQRRRIGLGEQLGLEIEPRREAQICMGRPGEAVDAAMLTPPVGIDRPIERGIRQIVAGDQRATGVMANRRAHRPRRLKVAGPIIPLPRHDA